ncbi:hypothetical protein PP301_gp007 [Gordonia phage GMA2]|uniref:Uncharacterized protein n=1 Tax=Gordonia phage GMA2 TaxID=1647283 RepID=A0A0K0N6T8_9CAUD|nr:hypothetical protein PP301_gp007 [Gordonia phage GMA2]AKJ72545.1 hypothetical protein GMA2_7 [Gordonia phage GMA2]
MKYRVKSHDAFCGKCDHEEKNHALRGHICAVRNSRGEPCGCDEFTYEGQYADYRSDYDDED